MAVKLSELANLVSVSDTKANYNYAKASETSETLCKQHLADAKAWRAIQQFLIEVYKELKENRDTINKLTKYIIERGEKSD